MLSILGMQFGTLVVAQCTSFEVQAIERFGFELVDTLHPSFATERLGRLN